MAKRTQLTITVDREGKVKTDFLHFTGRACMEASRQLQQALADFGLATEMTTFVSKPELFQPAAAQAVERQAVQQIQEGGY